MCLAVPMEVISIDNHRAVVLDQGVQISVDYSLAPDLAIGDKVLVHAGFVIEKLHPDEAKAIEDTWDEYLKNLPEP
jgi:hydrogenase expression/formation protein HypC